MRLGSTDTFLTAAELGSDDWGISSSERGPNNQSKFGPLAENLDRLNSDFGGGGG